MLISVSFPGVLFGQSLTIDANASVTIQGDGGAGTDGQLEVDGNLIINNAGQLIGEQDAQFFVSGDIIYNTDEPFVRGTSIFTLDGTSAQQISNTITNDDFQFFTLVLNNAAGFTVNTSGEADASIFGILDVQAGQVTTNNNLIIEAESATSYGRVAYSTISNPIDGEVTVMKMLSDTNAAWRQLSMPVAGNWEDGKWDSITFNFSPFSPSTQENAFFWDPMASGTADYANGWTPAPGTTSGLTPLTVYTAGDNGPFDVNQKFRCAGELRDNLPSFTFNLEDFRDPDDLTGIDPAAVGWNAIANPWAALVDVQALLTSTQTDAFGPIYKAVHVYNSVTGQYQAILLDNTVTKVDWNTDGSDIEDADANIPPFQSFWVKADPGNRAVTLYADEMQTTEQKNVANEQFMKQKPDLFRLNVFDRDSLWDQIVVFFKEGATREFDLVGDAYHLASPVEEAPFFYALEDKSAASILGRPLESTDSVEVAYGSKKAGTTFHIMPDISELPDDWNVYLKDRYTGQTVQVENRKSYAFINQNEESSKRFVIYFSKQPKAFNHLVTGEAPEIYAFAKDGQIAIQSLGISGPATINVFDMTGKQLQNQQVVLQTGDQHVINTTISGTMVMLSVEVNGRIENFKLFL